MNDINTNKSHKTSRETIPELKQSPPCFTSMEGRLISHKGDTELTIAFPVLGTQLNPAGSMQGGFMSAAFDNVFGPLCYMASKTPASSMVHMNTSYHRPVFQGDELTITARIKTKGRRIVHMEAEAYNREDKLVASAHCDYLITG